MMILDQTFELNNFSASSVKYAATHQHLILTPWLFIRSDAVNAILTVFGFPGINTQNRVSVSLKP